MHDDKLNLVTLVDLKVAERDIPENIALAKTHRLKFLKSNTHPQVRCYFESCIYDVQITIGNVQLYTYSYLIDSNRVSDISTVAHKSGYIEFAMYEADGSVFYVAPLSGKVFALSLGSVNEISIIGFKSEDNWDYIRIQHVDDKLMEEASWKSWPSLESFWQEDLRRLSNA